MVARWPKIGTIQKQIMIAMLNVSFTGSFGLITTLPTPAKVRANPWINAEKEDIILSMKENRVHIMPGTKRPLL